MVVEFKQRSKMHLNYGGGKHGYVYEIIADGRPTQITRTVERDRKSTLTDVFVCGEDQLNMLEGVSTDGMLAWLKLHLSEQPQ